MASESLGMLSLKGAGEAAAQEDYEAAYHFLMAGMHVADKTADFGLLDQICEKAKKYSDTIDAKVPEHPLSTSASMHRNHTPLFHTIQTHAKAVAARHRATRK